jgi:hypothetical protein
MPRIIKKLPCFLHTVMYARSSDCNQIVLEALNSDQALEQYISSKMDGHDQPARDKQQKIAREWAKSVGLDKGIPERLRSIIYELREAQEIDLAFKDNAGGRSLLQAGSKPLPVSNFEIHFWAKPGEVIATGRDSIIAWIPNNDSPNPLGLFLTYEVDEIYLKKPVIN